MDFSFWAAKEAQIHHLLNSVNDSNSETIFQELSQVAQHGTDESVLILRSCLNHLNFNGNDLKNVQLEPLCGLVLKFLLNRPNAITVFSVSLHGLEINVDFIANLSNALLLALPEKIGLGIALFGSENPDISMCGNNYCMAQIKELCNSHVHVGRAEQIHEILMFLRNSPDLAKHVDSFKQMLSLVQEDDQYILTPWVPDELHEKSILRNLLDKDYASDFDSFIEEMEKKISVPDVIKELGYEFTINMANCKEMLCFFSPLTEAKVARIVGTVARFHIGLEDNQNAYFTFFSTLANGNLSDMPSLSSWNTDVLVNSINQLVPGINWIHVIENLDHEGLYFPDEEAFSLFMSIFGRACQDPFPLHAICGSVWKNTEGQLSFLKYAVSVPPEVFTFAHSGRQLIYADAVHVHKSQVGLANHAWLCFDLLEVLCQLAECGHASAVRLMLKHPLEQCPEVLLLGMAHINTSYNLIQYEVSSTVLPKMLIKSTGSSMFLNLWHANPNLLLRGLIKTYSIDSDTMERILDICQELKILSPVLDMVPSYFGIRMAAVASRRELVDLEKWLSSKLIAYKDSFFEECLKFLKDIQFGTSWDVSPKFLNHTGSIWKQYLDTTPTLMKVLQAHIGLIFSSQLLEEMEKLLATNKHVAFAMKSGGDNELGQSDGYTGDIEEEANSYFQKMFSGELTIDVMIQMLARLKESGNKRERSLFDCMLGNVFEEYRYIPKYPEAQLKIAAVLFGSLIKHQLVTHLTLGVALRGVLDALRKAPESKMFVFGKMALEQFVDRLVEWPQCCNHILQISHLRVAHPDLVAFIERELAKISSGHSESDGHSASADQPQSFIEADSTNMEMPSSSPFPLTGSISKPIGTQVSNPVRLDESQNLPVNFSGYMKPPASPASLGPPSEMSSSHKSHSAASLSVALSSSTGFTRPSRSNTSARFGSALNIETLVAAAERKDSPLEAPASEVQDKISFIVNNLSASNFEAKANDFAEILKEPYYPWFAQYMVMKRASIEPNFHDLYLKFLDKVSSRSLDKEIVKVTYENCKVLLGSDLIKSSSEERSLLKNLGSWLGKITIGRNQVLRAREIDLKSLIMEAYEKGLMIAVIPFTSKVLEPCQSSVAYRPPNPYTMGILGLLTEIYTMPNLKMNLKFEIEVLFKNLGVDMKDVTPTSLLNNKVRQVERNPDFSNKDSVSQQHLVGDAKSSTISTLNQVDLPLEVASPSHARVHSNILSQYAAAPVHLSSGALSEDEKLAALGLSDPLPSAHGLLQRPPPFSVSQISTAASGIDQQVVVNPKLHSLGLYLHFQSVVPIAMERAIKETVTQVVQRSVSIATQTTKELVLKDYAMEMDETRIRNAAHLMVASLAGSLAHVTCKEPLRGSISSQLRNSLQGLNNTSELLEQAVQLVTNDNLDLGCALIEQSATEKAIQAIDGDIAQHLSMRRKQREGVGSAYFDTALYTQGHMGFLPEALRPKPGRLSHSQQRVYEDFVRLPWQNQAGQASHALPADSSASSVGAGMTPMFSSTSGLLNAGIYSSGTGNTGISVMPQPLELVSEDIKTSPTQHDRSSTHVATGDGTSVYVENDVVSGSFSSTLAPESHSVDTENSVKELVASSQSLPSTAATERVTSEPLVTTGDVVEKYQILLEKLETLVTNDATDVEIQGFVAEVPGMILKCISRDEVASAVAQKVFQGLYENASKSSLITAHLAILTAIRDVSKLVAKQLTSWVIYSEEDRKFNKEITVGLIRSELLNLAEYNVHMAKLLDGGRNKAATEFAISLIQTLLINDSKVISELHSLVDALAKLAARPGTPESLQQLVEVARNPAANGATLSASSFGKEDSNIQAKEEKAPNYSTSSREDNNVLEMESDPAGFRDQVQALFAEWYRICELPGVNDGACAHFVLQLLHSGLLLGNDTSDRFFRCLTEIAVSHCLSSEVVNSGPLQSSQQANPLSFLGIDIYAKLVFAILKFFPADQGSSKVSLLPKVLAVTVRFIQRDAEEKKSSFNPRPYFRLFINWLLDLGSMEPVYDGANFQVLSAFANAFHSLQPLKVPGFSFGWLELVSHKSFMPKLLSGNSQKGWPYMQRLLVDLFQFLEPFLRKAELGGPVHFLYKGTLRVLLVLLHDFPEFLCDYHFSFCDVIPPSCIQMRNIILSAFPRNMRLPDPSTPNLKIDLLAEITQSPRILSEVDAALKAKQIKGEVDEYLKNRQQGSSFLTDLKQKLLLPQGDAGRNGTRYNVPLINSLVLYVGIQAIQQLQAKSSHAQSIASNVPLAMYLVGAALDIFQTLIIDLDTEGRYLFLNAIANQLRYPNNHTHYFSFVLLYLFAESNQEIIQEQITRVLLERLIVNRPHPWGLLITFIELIKNPRYNFWSRSFTRCAPEIEKLFESVSRSCGGPKPVDEGVVSGGLSDNLH